MSERGREEVVGGGREVKDREGVRWRKYPDSSLICSTITPSEVLWKRLWSGADVRVYLHLYLHVLLILSQPYRSVRRNLIIRGVNPPFTKTHNHEEMR